MSNFWGLDKRYVIRYSKDTISIPFSSNLSNMATTKPKIIKNLTELRNEKVNRVQEKGLQRLDELFDALWEQAQGVMFLVTPTNRKNTLPKNADKEDVGSIIDHICPKCNQPVLVEPPVIYEVWKERRDSGLLKYLFDQQVGRSSQKDKDVVDPEIIIVFGDIDSDELNFESNNKIQKLAELNNTPQSLTAQDATEPSEQFGLTEL